MILTVLTTMSQQKLATKHNTGFAKAQSEKAVDKVLVKNMFDFPEKKELMIPVGIKAKLLQKDEIAFKQAVARAKKLAKKVPLK